MALDVLDGDRRIVDQDADGQRQAADCHQVDGLAQRFNTRMDDRMDSGIDTAMMQVLRQLPRKSRISAAFSSGVIILIPDIARMCRKK